MLKTKWQHSWKRIEKILDTILFYFYNKYNLKVIFGSEGTFLPNIYRALGDSTRRGILSLLKQGNKTQKELVEAFDISQPAIKKHLKILLEEKIISESMNGKYRIYSLNVKMLQIAYLEMHQYIGELLDQQLVSLKNYLEKGEFRDEDN
ncbi:metalloregulator ArsR/SmtB family transcription factor [Virgibacillus sp. YIM 98842]|uniref:ArsR/SmtB family transcription factor n=1 Tax=Virgibacillus sp. YIM 98842 TaxID=2663533 RepID=UPI0013DB381B|nr:metalloregulator ArsR/SmtB family transcription factor [Virgibacillus sp. YIM 98842]